MQLTWTCRLAVALMLGAISCADAATALPDENTPPYIFASITNQTLRPNQSTGPLPFLVLDAEFPASSLVVTASSSDSSVVPIANIVFDGSGANRTVTVTAVMQPGSSSVSVYVADPGGESNSFNFAITVLAANLPPFISLIPRTNTLVNVPAPPIHFTVGDPESAAADLTVSAVSANPELVPNMPAALAFGGSGSNRTLTVTPASGQTGVAPITATVSDGTNTATAVFPLMVLPTAAMLFYEPFTYPDGSLLTNSAFLWDNRSGVYGQCQVSNSQLLVTAAQTEDVTGRLIGGPYVKGSNTVLYAGFQVKFLSLPGDRPGCFAHFGNGSTLVGRISATTSGQDGFFNLLAANGSNTNSVLANNLSLNTTYTVVERYAVDTASTTLWVNPVSESDSNHVAATDSINPSTVSYFGFRQDADIGASILVDELKVGLSFAAVTTVPAPSPIPLSIQRDGPNVILTWTNSAFTLQAAPTMNGSFTNIPVAASPFTNPVAGPARFFRLRAS